MTRDEFEERKHDGSREIIDSEEVLFIDMPEVGFHLHHWQIFYYLAFFTRFDNVISEICAGLVIGIFMHGMFFFFFFFFFLIFFFFFFLFFFFFFFFFF